ncbi:MAG: hypothetical protein IPN01_00335 [Deltaproteobacteria bacterium]|nr:hypothetical protein [Deltaproteobacteria bacterium]
MRVTEALPLDGEANLGTNATISLQLDGAVLQEDVALSLSPPAPTRVAVGPDELVFTPDGPLAPETEYVWSVTLCGQELSSGRFTTRTYGEAVGPRDLVDRAFQLDTRKGRWALGALEAEYVARYGGILLIEVIEGNASALDLLLAPGTDLSGAVVQSVGPLTRSSGVPFHHNPYLGLRVERMALTPPNGAVTLSDLNLELAFTNAGVGLSDGRISATVDLREPSAEGLAERCAAFEAELGVGCSPCEDGEAACVSVQIEGVGGWLVAGLHLKEEEADDTGR